jgi:hypothetical protein
MGQNDSEAVEQPEVLRALAAVWQVQSRPFTSRIPLLGPAIVALRRAWYNMAARWQDQLLFEQQNHFNQAVYEALVRQQQAIEDLGDMLYERGLEAGALAEELARLKLESEDENRA